MPMSARTREDYDREFGRQIKQAKEKFGDDRVVHGCKHGKNGHFFIKEDTTEVLGWIQETPSLEITGGGDHPDVGDSVIVRVKKPHEMRNKPREVRE